MLFVLISMFGYRLYAKPARFQERLGNAVGLEQPVAQPMQPQQSWVVRAAQVIGEKVPLSPQDATLARRYLIAAGYRSDTAVRVYYGIKIAGCVALFLVSLLLRGYIENPILSIMILPAGAGAGYFLPNFILERIIDRRHERLRLALPDALDLMVVCMEAGLGLDQALVNVARELQTTHKDISDELGLVTLEMRAGKRRGEALKNLGDRTGEPELKKLVATMIQSDRFGTGVGESLRTHSDFMRVRRRQEAEERAAKVGVKLVFPIFLFILPSILVVAAGPALLQLFKQLFPLMNGVR
jgi:tight adherence protein C